MTGRAGGDLCLKGWRTRNGRLAPSGHLQLLEHVVHWFLTVASAIVSAHAISLFDHAGFRSDNTGCSRDLRIRSRAWVARVPWRWAA
jgi:hypothetical protein